MQVAQLPTNEELRLETLLRYNILDTPKEEEYEHLVEIVHHITGCPIVAITFLDRERLWIKAEKGIGLSSYDRSIALCSHTILEEKRLVIENLKEDSRFTDHPLVEGGICLRFYAGNKISAPNGHAMGTLCVADTVPRNFTESQIAALDGVTRQICFLLELRLQNIALRKRAQELITLEQRTVQRNLLIQESERQQIAYRLHEGVAQSLAACHNFLSYAEQNELKRLDVVQTTRKEILRLTKEVRDFTRTVAPTTLKKVHPGEMLRQLVTEITKKVPLKIILREEGDGTQVSWDAAMAIYRNVQDYFNEVQEDQSASKVIVRLKITGKISLLMVDNRPPQTVDVIEVNPLLRTIHNRTLHFSGSVSYKASCSKGNVILISMPLDA